MSKEISGVVTPKVPDELQVFVDDNLMDVHNRWSMLSVDDIHSAMEDVVHIPFGENTAAGQIITPEQDYDPTTALVWATPHQTEWKPSTFVRASIIREVVAPDSQLVVLTSNNLRQDSYVFDRLEQKSPSVSIRTLAEKQTRTLEQLELERVALTGYSLGALVMINLARVSPDIEIVAVNADEMPSKPGRTVKELRKDFMNSGGWAEWTEAVQDSNIPALEEILSTSGKAIDFAKFGVGSLRKHSRMLQEAMAGSHFVDLLGALNRTPRAKYKLSHIDGSLITDLEDKKDKIREVGKNFNRDVRLVRYSGAGTHGHATGDNPYALATMALDGLGKDCL